MEEFFWRYEGKRYRITAPSAEKAAEKLSQKFGLTVGPGDLYTSQQVVENFPVRTRLASWAQGIPFVGAQTDELAGFLAEKLEGLPRERVAADVREGAEHYEALHPTQSAVGKAALGIGATIPLAASAPALPMLPGLGGRILSGAGYGAAGGATEGAIYALGENGPDVSASDRAAEGGLLGGLLGAAVPAVGAIGGALYRAVRPAVDATRRAGLDRATADALAPVLEADSASMAQNFARAGNDAMLADAGPTARRLAQLLANQPGPAANIVRQAVGERTAEMNRALKARLAEALLPPGSIAGRSIRETARAISRERGPKVSEAYKRAFATPIDYASPAGREVERVLGAVPSKLMGRAVEIANNRAMVEALDNPAATMPQIKISLSPDGRLLFAEMPTLRQVNEIKRALQDIAEQNTDAITGKKTPEAVDASKLAERLRDAAIRATTGEDGRSPYAEALKLGSDRISEDTALVRFGRNIFDGTDPEDFAADVGKLSEEALMRAREGALRSIELTFKQARQAMDRVGPDAEQMSELRSALSRLRRPDVQEKLLTLLGPERFRPLVAQIEQSAGALELSAAIRAGSPTAPLLQAEKAIERSTASTALGRLATAPRGEVVRKVLGTIIGPSQAAREKAKRDLNERLARALTARFPPAAAEQMARSLAQIPERRIRTDTKAALLDAQIRRLLGLPAYSAATNVLTER